jgi:large subunit ribosomal protein L4
MSKVPILDSKGQHCGEHDVPDELLVFDKGAQALHEAVVAYRANQRAGTASTRTKGEVKATGAKPWRQKGLGRARAGYRSSPVWRGGGVAFGPKPRDYAKSVNRKAAGLAFRRAFSDRVSAGQVSVIEELDLAEPKTKRFVERLGALPSNGAVLVIVDAVDQNLKRASRNVARVSVKAASEVNVFDLVRHATLFMTPRGAGVLQARLAKSAGRTQ